MLRLYLISTLWTYYIKILIVFADEWIVEQIIPIGTKRNLYIWEKKVKSKFDDLKAW